MRYPILQHIARYLCDTPGKQTRKSFAILSLKVSRDMKSVAAGPLSFLCSLGNAQKRGEHCPISRRRNKRRILSHLWLLLLSWSSSEAGRNQVLEYCKWGFKRWGFKEIWRSSDPPEKGRKREKKGGKGEKRPASRKGSLTLLKPPHLLHPHLRQQIRFGGLRVWRVSRPEG